MTQMWWKTEQKLNFYVWHEIAINYISICDTNVTFDISITVKIIIETPNVVFNKL